jgi:hypothetical protein
MNTEALIDYAYPMMMAENAMKEAHIHMLNREYDQAVEQMLVAITEARMTLNAVKHMKKQHDALRKQTQTV